MHNSEMKVFLDFKHEAIEELKSKFCTGIPADFVVFSSKNWYHMLNNLESSILLNFTTTSLGNGFIWIFRKWRALFWKEGGNWFLAAMLKWLKSDLNSSKRHSDSMKEIDVALSQITSNFKNKTF